MATVAPAAAVSAPTSSSSPDQQGSRQQANRPRARRPAAKPPARDPQKPVAHGKGDLDFDDPSQPAPAPKPRRQAAKPAAAVDDGDQLPPPKPRKKLASAPEGGKRSAPAAESEESSNAEDTYERVGKLLDERAGIRTPKSRKPAEDRRKPELADDRDDEDEVDSELVVGDELYVPEQGDDEDDEEQGETAEETAETEEDLFPKTLLREALEYDFTEEEARAFGSPVNLQKAMTAIDRQLKLLGGKQAAEVPEGKKPAGGDTSTDAKPTQDSGRTANEPPKETRLGKPAAENAGDSAPKILKFEDLEPEPGYFDEPTRSMMTKVLDTYNGHVGELQARTERAESRFESFVKHVGEMESLRFTDEMDDYFDGLVKENKDYEAIFGKGSWDELDETKDANAIKTRLAFIKEMSQLAKGLRESGGKLPSRRKIKQRVLRSFDPVTELREKQIRRETTEKVTRREKNRIAEPTHREGLRTRDMSPDKAAGNFADDFYRKHGYHIDSELADDDNDV